jgi:hypothetical protein
MGFFNRSLSQTFELTRKQVNLEYGGLFVTGEIVEKAVKLSWDRWIFTNLRLILVLASKKGLYEYQSIPYRSCRMFSTVKRNASEEEVELQVFLHDEAKPVTMVMKDLDLLDEISGVLTKHICTDAGDALRVPSSN